MIMAARMNNKINSISKITQVSETPKTRISRYPSLRHIFKGQRKIHRWRKIMMWAKIRNKHRMIKLAKRIRLPSKFPSRQTNCSYKWKKSRGKKKNKGRRFKTMTTLYRRQWTSIFKHRKSIIFHSIGKVSKNHGKSVRRRRNTSIMVCT